MSSKHLFQVLTDSDWERELRRARSLSNPIKEKIKLKLNPQNPTPFKQPAEGMYRVREKNGWFFPEQKNKDGVFEAMNGGVSFWTLQGAKAHINTILNAGSDIFHPYP